MTQVDPSTTPPAGEPSSLGSGPEAGLESGAPSAPIEPPSGTEGANQPPAATEPPRTFVVKVNGQEQEVPETELVNGYQRQSDYTTKTQQLAAERQRLVQAEAIWNALQEDPAGTMQALQDHFKDVLTAPPAEASAPDPLQERLDAHEAFIQEQQQREAQQQVDTELNGLYTEYGQFDGNELLQYAVDNQIPNLRAAYLHREDANARLQRERAARDAKLGQPPIAGGSRAAGTTAPPPLELADMTLDRAMEAAKAELGWPQ